MRTHRDILRDIGHGHAASHFSCELTTVRSWAQRNSIPADRWMLLSQSGFASLEELAAGASNKRTRQGRPTEQIKGAA